jgi:uncharacterized protein YegP (UPF0339 family)
LGTLLVFVALPLIAPAVVRAADKDPLTFEMFEDKDKEFRWRLKQGDDIIATSGQGYKAKASCQKAIEGIKKGLTNDKDTFEIYEDNAKAFRWRLKASNGQIVAAANKGFKTKADCEKLVNLIKKEASKATVVEEKK